MSDRPLFSIIIPAHNEEKYVERCISSVLASAKAASAICEIIVVCNRCTDKTAVIAEACGARTLGNTDRCIAKVRNDGILAAQGEIIVTIDCDNRMTIGTLSEIRELLGSGKYVGGGASIRFERHSFPLWLNEITVRGLVRLTGLYSGIFWARRETFVEVGCFPETMVGEDLALAKNMKKYAKANKKRYTQLKQNYLINSTRKFDAHGDWLMFRLMFRGIGALFKALFGDKAAAQKMVDEVFYDYNG